MGYHWFAYTSLSQKSFHGDKTHLLSGNEKFRALLSVLRVIEIVFWDRDIPMNFLSKVSL